MMIDLSHYGCVKVSGEDAQTFLQGQLTCDMGEITGNKTSYAAYCNQKGRVIAVLRVIKSPDAYYLLTTGTYVEPLLKNLKKFGQFSKVDITLASPALQHYGFCGDDAINNLKEILNVDLPISVNEVVSGECFLLFKNCGENNFEFISWIPVSTGMTTTQPDDSAWQLALIDSMVPAITENTCEKFTPHMLGLKNLDALSFTKGCYIGQEVVARTEHLGKSKRKLLNGISEDGSLDISKGTIINSSKLTDNTTKWLAVVSTST